MGRQLGPVILNLLLFETASGAPSRQRWPFPPGGLTPTRPASQRFHPGPKPLSKRKVPPCPQRTRRPSDYAQRERQPTPAATRPVRKEFHPGPNTADKREVLPQP